MHPETAATQSAAAAAGKLKKLMHKEPAVRVLLAERDKLLTENANLKEQLAPALARITELEAQLAQPVIIKGDAGDDIEVTLGDIGTADATDAEPKAKPAKKGK